MNMCAANVIIMGIVHVFAIISTVTVDATPGQQTEPDWQKLNADMRIGKITSVIWSNDSSCVFYRSATGGTIRCFFPADQRIIHVNKSIAGKTQQYARYRRRPPLEKSGQNSFRKIEEKV